GGITEQVSAKWLADFIRNPRSVIESGDVRAVSLHQQYKSVMPAFDYLNDDEVQGIIAYLHTQKAAPKRTVSSRDAEALEDPIPEGIPMSDLVVEMKYITQFPASGDPKLRARVTK